MIKALNAGKHVISDKPLCTSLEELAKIEQIANENKLKIACMLDLRNISFTGQHCIDYAHRPGWYFEEGMHGGTINDLAIHGIDLVRELTGLEIEKTDGIRTWNSYAVKNPDFKDCAVFMARLTNVAELLADVSYSAPPQVYSMPTYWNFQIWCEKGMLTFHLTDENVTVFEEGVTEPQILEGIAPGTNYLKDLMREINSDSDSITKSVIASTRTALQIQKEANQV